MSNLTFIYSTAAMWVDSTIHFKDSSGSKSLWHCLKCLFLAESLPLERKIPHLVRINWSLTFFCCSVVVVAVFNSDDVAFFVETSNFLFLLEKKSILEIFLAVASTGGSIITKFNIEPAMVNKKVKIWQMKTIGWASTSLQKMAAFSEISGVQTKIFVQVHKNFSSAPQVQGKIVYLIALRCGISIFDDFTLVQTCHLLQTEWWYEKKNGNLKTKRDE